MRGDKQGSQESPETRGYKEHLDFKARLDQGVEQERVVTRDNRENADNLDSQEKTAKTEKLAPPDPQEIQDSWDPVESSESRVSQEETVTLDPRVVKEGEVYVDRPVPRDPKDQ